MARKIRIECEQRTSAGRSLIDMRTGVQGWFYRGEAIILELALFANGVMLTKADLTSIKLVLKVGATIYSTTTIPAASLSASITAHQWRTGVAALVSPGFSASATGDLPAGMLTFEITGILTTGTESIYASGTIEAVTLSGVPATPPTPSPPTSYTKAETDGLMDALETDVLSQINIGTDYDVILIAGQSNAADTASMGYDSALDEFPELNLMRQLNRSAPTVSTVGSPSVIPITNPMKHWSQPSIFSGYLPWQTGHVGFPRFFGREYVRQGHLTKGRRLLFVPCARPGSSFSADQWGIGNPNYTDLVTMAQWVQNNLTGSRILGLLWHQGESDVGFATYQVELDAMFEQLRVDLDIPDLPIVVGGMVPIWTNQQTDRKTQQAIIRDTARRIDYCAYADPERPTWLPTWKDGDVGDSIHFDVTECREFGVRYFNAWLRAKIGTPANAVPPAAPADLVLAKSPDGTITATFTEPEDYGYPITSLAVRHWTGAAPAFNVAATSSTFTDRGSNPVSGKRELTITGLTAGTLHTFQVACVNAGGQGDWCSEKQITPAVITNALDAISPVFLSGESFLNRGTAGGYLSTGRGIEVAESDLGPALRAMSTAAQLTSGYTPTALTAASISLWFKPRKLTHGFLSVADQQWLVVSNTFNIVLLGPALYCGFGPAPTLVSVGGVDEDTWHHLYVGWNGSTGLTVHLDNDLLSTAVCSGGSSPDPLLLFGNNGGGSWFGDVRDFRVHNRELTAAERLTLFNAVTLNITGEHRRLHLPINVPKTITSVGTGSTVTVNATGHGLVVGQLVAIAGVAGATPLTAVNTVHRVVAVTDANNFTITPPAAITVGGTGGTANNSVVQFGSAMVNATPKMWRLTAKSRTLGDQENYIASDIVRYDGVGFFELTKMGGTYVFETTPILRGVSKVSASHDLYLVSKALYTSLVIEAQEL